MSRMSKEAAMALLDESWIEAPYVDAGWVCHVVDEQLSGVDSVHVYDAATKLVHAVTYAEPWLHADDPADYDAVVEALEQARRDHGDAPTEALRGGFNEILKGTMQVVWWGKGAEYPHREMDEEEE